MKHFSVFLILLALAVLRASCDEKDVKEDSIEEPKVQEKETEAAESSEPSTKPGTESETEAKGGQEQSTTSEETPEDHKKYQIGSLCNYCSYCKFCELCDKECPCETSKRKPNCQLCKYCKYCSLCSICDVACTPGGIVDMVSSAIYSSLPTFTKKEKEEVDKDIDHAKDWIKEYL